MDWWLIVTILALSGLAMLAWSLGAMDVSGAAAAWLLGFWVAVFGSLQWLLIMTLFTILGVAATAYGRARKKSLGLGDGDKRSWKNVVANGAAAALAVVAFLVVDEQAATLAFATALAAVTADTMASEVGCLSPRPRRIVPPFEAMAPGSNGAVSASGQVAAAIGAISIAVAAVWLGPIAWHWVWVPALGGFLGCQIDSILGATLEGDQLQDRPLSKQDVNFLASAVPALVVLVVFAL